MGQKDILFKNWEPQNRTLSYGIYLVYPCPHLPQAPHPGLQMTTGKLLGQADKMSGGVGWGKGGTCIHLHHIQ